MTTPLPEDDRLTPGAFYGRVVPALTALVAAVALAGIGFLAFAFCRKCDFLFAGGFILEWL